MSALQVIDGWQVERVDGEEPRVRDLEIAERAGMKDPHKVRTRIEQNWDELAAHGEIRVSARRAETSGGRPGVEYWLTEDQAVALVALLRTPQARALRVALVKLFGALRRGELVQQTARLPLELASGPCIGDVPAAKREVSQRCAMVAKALRVHVNRVHGDVRVRFRTPGVHKLSIYALEQLRNHLDDLGLGKEHLRNQKPARVLRLASSDRRQANLPGVE